MNNIELWIGLLDENKNEISKKGYKRQKIDLKSTKDGKGYVNIKRIHFHDCNEVYAGYLALYLSEHDDNFIKYSEINEHKGININHTLVFDESLLYVAKDVIENE